MNKIRLIKIKDVGYDERHLLASFITDWTEVSDEDYDLLYKHLYTLGDDLKIIEDLTDEIPNSIEKIKKKIKKKIKEEENRQKKVEEEYKKKNADKIAKQKARQVEKAKKLLEQEGIL